MNGGYKDNPRLNQGGEFGSRQQVALYFFSGAVPIFTSSAESIFILVSMWASMTTRTPGFRSVFLAALSFIKYFVFFSSMIVTGLLSLPVMVNVSLVTAVTVPRTGSPCASNRPAHNTIAAKQITNRFNIEWVSFF